MFPDDYQQMCTTQLKLLKKISRYINELQTLVHDMIDARKVANVITDIPTKAATYYDTVYPFVDKIRVIADKLEMVVDDELWPLPKYREMLFLR